MLMLRYVIATLIGICVSAVAASLSAASSAVVVETSGAAVQPSLATAITTIVREASYETTIVSANALSHPDTLADRCDLLVFPEAGKIPYAAFPAINRYLKSGKPLMALGTPLWPEFGVKVEGRWMSKPDWMRSLMANNPRSMIPTLRDEDTKRWIHIASEPSAEGSVEIVNDHTGPALCVSIPNLIEWHVISREGVSFPPGHLLTCFRAKGDNKTQKLHVEWVERDHTRWVTMVDLTTEWQTYVLPPSFFHLWSSDKSQRRLNVADAVRFTVGLETYFQGQVDPGSHRFWIADLGTSAGQDMDLDENSPFPTLISLSPWHQFYPIVGPVSLAIAPGQVIVGKTDVAVQGPLLGLHPRATASGFEKDRPWRWQPLLEARAPDGDYRGAVAALIVHLKGAYQGGVWAVFTPADPAFYRQAGMRHTLRQTMARLRCGLLLQEGGAAFYTHFENQPVRLGARVLALGPVPSEPAAVHIVVTAVDQATLVYQREWRVAPKPGAAAVVSDVWKPPQWPAGGYRVVVELRSGGQVLDRLSHEIHVLRPTIPARFIKARHGGLWLEDKPWKAHGVNYMPSSGIGIPLELTGIFDGYLGADAYDPVVIDRDLRRIRGMGFNAVSVFLYHKDLKAMNLLDLLRRCSELDLHVNLSLRPGTPMDFPWELVREMIQFLRLAQNDTVFAYDLAWEPSHGPYQNRKTYSPEWERWIVAKYGSLQAAENTWGVPVPREQGRVSVPKQLTDGAAQKLTLDYLTFLDDLLTERYGNARQLVRSIDPNHAVSFRMAFAGDPLELQSDNFAYDFFGLRNVVDIWEPEGYGRIGNWENRVKPGLFTVAYARLCCPNKPVVWAELGYPLYYHAGIARVFLPFEEQLAQQANQYHHFYRLLRESGSDGVFFWWYAGGHRVNEQSDFGIINPDGTDRSVTQVIRQEGPLFLAAVKPLTGREILVDRGVNIRGVAGMYEQVKNDFWKAVEKGANPRLKWKTP